MNRFLVLLGKRVFVSMGQAAALATSFFFLYRDVETQQSINLLGAGQRCAFCPVGVLVGGTEITPFDESTSSLTNQKSAQTPTPHLHNTERPFAMNCHEMLKHFKIRNRAQV